MMQEDVMPRHGFAFADLRRNTPRRFPCCGKGSCLGRGRIKEFSMPTVAAPEPFA